MFELKEFENRLEKRWRHLQKWVKKNDVEYFRLYDRDIHQAPLIIDRLKDCWLVWVCEHDSEDMNPLLMLTADRLKELAIGEVFIKDRTKDKRLKITSECPDKIITEGGLKFKVKPTQYLDTGLFIDHRLLREYIRSISKGKRVLNLFSYTGSVSCYAIAGGAAFTRSVDISPVYSEWHQENCELNMFDPNTYGILTRDCRKFLWESKEQFDIIFCDPPSFSQTKRNHLGHFQVQEHGGELIEQCLKRLCNGGQLIFSTNFRKFKLEKAFNINGQKIKELTNQLCSKDFEGKWGSRCWEIKRSN